MMHFRCFCREVPRGIPLPTTITRCIRRALTPPDVYSTLVLCATVLTTLHVLLRAFASLRFATSGATWQDAVTVTVTVTVTFAGPSGCRGGYYPQQPHNPLRLSVRGPG
eukprot:4297322-Pyramimonas_sp.AAC.1